MIWAILRSVSLKLQWVKWTPPPKPRNPEDLRSRTAGGPSGNPRTVVSELEVVRGGLASLPNWRPLARSIPDHIMQTSKRSQKHAFATEERNHVPVPSLKPSPCQTRSGGGGKKKNSKGKLNGGCARVRLRQTAPRGRRRSRQRLLTELPGPSHFLHVRGPEPQANGEAGPGFTHFLRWPRGKNCLGADLFWDFLPVFFLPQTVCRGFPWYHRKEPYILISRVDWPEKASRQKPGAPNQWRAAIHKLLGEVLGVFLTVAKSKFLGWRYGPNPKS